MKLLLILVLAISFTGCVDEYLSVSPHNTAIAEAKCPGYGAGEYITVSGNGTIPWAFSSFRLFRDGTGEAVTSIGQTLELHSIQGSGPCGLFTGQARVENSYGQWVPFFEMHGQMTTPTSIRLMIYMTDYWPYEDHIQNLEMVIQQTSEE